MSINEKTAARDYFKSNATALELVEGECFSRRDALDFITQSDVFGREDAYEWLKARADSADSDNDVEFAQCLHKFVLKKEQDKLNIAWHRKPYNK